MDVEWQDAPEYSLSENDTNVLHVLEEENLTSFTFGGLKRRLGVHPESLSRALYRLEDQGIVEKGLGGYEVTPKAKEFLRFHSLDTEEPRVQLLRTLLPPDAPAHQIISDLQGRWFGMLRWLGCSENEGVGKLKFKPTLSDSSFGVCTSSGTVGHSYSQGRADAVCVVSQTASQADAAATAMGNKVKHKKDIGQVIQEASNNHNILGIIVALEDKLGIWGEVEII